MWLAFACIKFDLIVFELDDLSLVCRVCIYFVETIILTLSSSVEEGPATQFQPKHDLFMIELVQFQPQFFSLNTNGPVLALPRQFAWFPRQYT